MAPPTDQWRKLSKWERETLERMLQEAFTGRDALREQLSGARVRTIDEEGSLRFEGSADTAGYWNPVIARGEDRDGIPIEVLLLVDEDERLNELDIWKGDGSPITRKPEPANLQILVRDTSGSIRG